MNFQKYFKKVNVILQLFSVDFYRLLYYNKIVLLCFVFEGLGFYQITGVHKNTADTKLFLRDVLWKLG